MLKAIEEFFRRRAIARAERQRIREQSKPASWLLTQSDGAPSLRIPFNCTEAQALLYLRQNFPAAQIDHIDREWHVIFYRIIRPITGAG